MITMVDPLGTEYQAYEPGEAPDGCPECHQPISEHIDRNACNPGVVNNTGGSWWNLPMAASAWRDAANGR
jgi:hypothetical protein